MKTEKEQLKERAKKIAARNVDENQSKRENVSVVEFSLTPERYAFEEKYVSEVVFLKELTPVPGTPPYVMGLINLRGRIVSVINLKVLINLKQTGLTEMNKVMILKNEEMEFGVAADAIAGNKLLDLNTLNSVPLTLEYNATEFIKGVTPEGLILLSASGLLSNKKIIINQ